MTGLPYDPDNPPAEPPEGCDALKWMLAYRIHAEHQPGPDGMCLSPLCRRESMLWPCEASQLARTGFVDACWLEIMKRRHDGETPEDERDDAPCTR